MTEDHILIEQAQNGSMTAFRELVDRYKKKIYNIALDMTGNHHDAEDISQDVFIKVYRSLYLYRGDAKFSTWVYRITSNTCIDKSRKKSWKALLIKENMDQNIKIHDAYEKKKPQLNPEKSAESDIIQKHIQAALQTLSNRERIIFIMRHYNDLPLKEIASSLQITEGTVKSTLFRALKRLQKKLYFYKQDLGLENSHE